MSFSTPFRGTGESERIRLDTGFPRGRPEQFFGGPVPIEFSGVRKAARFGYDDSFRKEFGK